MNKILVDNTTIKKEFFNHLSLSNNKRILFSAPFGSGKSYFIKEFFVEEKDFIIVNLNPINYSVSSDEDIFELIKYDIIDYLTEFFIEELNLNTEDISKIFAAVSFLNTKVDFLPILTSLVKISSLSLVDMSPVVKDSKDLYKQFKDFTSELKKDEYAALKIFMNEIEEKKGTPKERDYITILIKDFISRIKSKRDNKEIILIVEDLDRLERDQIFRLFNIFTAHNDSKTDENKFGFDKVIFVCDINNIEFMFKHKYGSKSNFDGYIDKFYSYNPYNFNHKKFLKEKVVDYLTDKINIGEFLSKHPKESFTYNFYNSNSDFFHVILDLCYKLIDENLLRIRNFQHFNSYSIPNSEFKINNRVFNEVQFPLLALIHILKQFYPRIEDLLNIVDDLSLSFESNYSESGSSSFQNHQEKGLISYSIPFFVENLEDLMFERNSEKDIIVPVISENGLKIFLVFNIKDEFTTDFKQFFFRKAVKSETMINDHSPERELKRPNPFLILSKAFKNCLKKGYIE